MFLVRDYLWLVSASNASCHMKMCISYKYGTGFTKCTILVLSYLIIGQQLNKPVKVQLFAHLRKVMQQLADHMSKVFMLRKGLVNKRPFSFINFQARDINNSAIWLRAMTYVFQPMHQ